MRKEKIIRGIKATLLVITLPIWMILSTLISAWKSFYEEK